jgi:predicted permease
MAVRANVVTDRYFDALGIPLLRGRHFSASDQPSAPPVAIVSRGLAARLWGTAEAIGRPVMVGDRPAEVIGVVADSIYVSTVERNPPPLLYFPLSQRYESGMTLHLRTASDPMSVVPAVRAAIREIDPQLVLARPRLLSSEFERSLGAERMMAVLVGLFGAVALLLAVVGLYGVMAHLASQRTTEIGIRLALGARPSSILRLMVGSGLRLVGIGTILGLAGAAAGTRLLANQLFDVSPTDPATFGAVVIVLITVAVAACVVPARRAMRVDPATALRHP